MKYHHLCIDERNLIQQKLNERLSLGRIASDLNRDKATISREVRRGIARTKTQTYCAQQTHQQARQHRHRGHSKLSLDHPNGPTIRGLLDQGWSPQQITGRLKRMYPDQPQ